MAGPPARNTRSTRKLVKKPQSTVEEIIPNEEQAYAINDMK